MTLSFQTPIIIVILFAVIAFAIAYYFYQYTVPQVSTAKRWTLTIVRGVALTLIFLSLCEPILQWIATEEKKPTIAVLVDNSLSMSQTDRRGNKEQQLRTLIQSDGLKEFSSSVDLQLFSFSHSVNPVSTESLTVNGGSTNISGALQSSLKNIDDLQGIILVSDGNYNAGVNPLYDAEKSRVPIFTVGIGDTIEQKDISVSKLLTNSIGYVETEIPVDATIKTSGITPQQISVTLLEDGKVMEEKRIDVSSANGTAEHSIRFLYTPTTDGVKKLSVRVSSVEGELTEKNNLRSALVKVLKNKLNIAVLSGAVSADVSTIMQTLNLDKNIASTLFYQLPNGEFKSQKENVSFPSILQNADCLILIGFPTAQTSANNMQTIVQAITNISLPVLFVNARTVDLQRVRLMENIFPFTVSAERIDEQSVLPNVQSLYRFHSLVKTDRSEWEKLPPIFYSFSTFSSKPESQSLLGIKIQNVTLNNPLFLIRSVGNTKSAAILGYGIHRWKILAGSADETKDFFDVWFSNLIRWLSTREQDKRLKVEPSKEFYAQGEEIEFSGQVYNESYQPIDNADLRIALRSLKNSQRFETTLSSVGSGLYEGKIDGLAEGEYSYSAAALNNGDTLGSVVGRISVGEQSIEFAETKTNVALLQQIANSSGGEYADAETFNTLLEKISLRSDMQARSIVQTSEFELWNLPTFLTLIVLLFGIEWFIRKRSGML